MKKLAALAFAALYLLSACASMQPSAREEPAPLTVIGVSQVGAESDWRVANSESMKSVFTEERGYRLLFEDARQKQENQISAIRRFIQQRVDYIVLMPIQERGWDSVLQEAREADIPVILVDRMAAVEDESLYAAHVGSDFLEEGRQAVEWLDRQAQGETLNIIHIQGTKGSTAQLGRTQALEEGMADHPGWQLLALLDGDFTQAKTYEALGEYLDSQPERPDIHVVYCENDNEAFGAIQALEERGFSCGPEGVRIISFDATRRGLTYCLEGKIALAAECDPLLGPLVEEVIQILEAGGTPDKHYYAQERLFTPEDLTPNFIQQWPY